MIPSFELPPVLPFTVQFTPVLDVPVTVAVNCTVFPGATEAAVGVMDTATVDPDPACALAGTLAARNRTQRIELIEVDLTLCTPGSKPLSTAGPERLRVIELFLLSTTGIYPEPLMHNGTKGLEHGMEHPRSTADNSLLFMNASSGEATMNARTRSSI